MVDQIQVVAFDTPAAPGTIDVTSPLITETFSAAILIFSRSLSDDTNNVHGVMGIGFIAPDGAAEEDRCSGCQIEDTAAVPVTVPDNNQFHGADRCIRASNGLFNDTLNHDIVAAYSASIAGGVRLSFTTTTVQARCTAILFAGLARASVMDHATSSVGTSELVGDAGVGRFTPDVLLFLGSDLNTNNDDNDAIPNLGLALNAAGLPQISAYTNFDDGTEPTDADGIVQSATAWGHLSHDAARALIRPTVTAYTATGFDMISDVGGSSPQANYLALKWSNPSRVRVAVANMAVAASTGNQSFNAFGFPPDVVFGMATLLGAVDTLTDGATASAAGFFAFSKSAARAYSVCSREGRNIPADGETDARTRQGAHALLMLDHTGAVVQQATYAGASGGGGFLLDFATASASGFMTAIGFQIIPSPPIPLRRHDGRARTARYRRTRKPIVVGGVKRAIGPVVRFMQAILRNRRKVRARLWYRPRLVPQGAMLIGAELEEHSIGRVASPGAIRGAIFGPGVVRRDEVD